MPRPPPPACPRCGHHPRSAPRAAPPRPRADRRCWRGLRPRPPPAPAPNSAPPGGRGCGRAPPRRMRRRSAFRRPHAPSAARCGRAAASAPRRGPPPAQSGRAARPPDRSVAACHAAWAHARPRGCGARAAPHWAAAPRDRAAPSGARPDGAPAASAGARPRDGELLIPGPAPARERIDHGHVRRPAPACGEGCKRRKTMRSSPHDCQAFDHLWWAD